MPRGPFLQKEEARSLPTDSGFEEFSTPERLAERLSIWAGSVPQGLALVVTNDVKLRQAAIELIAKRFIGEGRRFRNLELPWLDDARDVGSTLMRALQAAPFELVSVTGFVSALGNKAGAADGLRHLNTYREAFSDVPGCQVWWMNPIMVQSFRQLAPDLYRWFVLVERLPDRDESVPGTVWQRLSSFEERAAFRASDPDLSDAAEILRQAGEETSADEFGEIEDRLVIALRVPGPQPPRFGGLADIVLTSPTPNQWQVRNCAEALSDQGREATALQVLQAWKAGADSSERDSLAWLESDLLRALGRPEEALKAAQIYLDELNQDIAQDGESKGALLEVTKALGRLGMSLADLGNVDDATKSFCKAAEGIESVISRYGSSPELFQIRSTISAFLGKSLQSLGNEEEALSVFLRSLADIEVVFVESGDSRDAVRHRSIDRYRVGSSLRALGRDLEALDYFTKSLEDAEAVLAKYGESPRSLRDRSYSLSWLADAFWDLGREEDAAKTYQRSIEDINGVLFKYGESLTNIVQRSIGNRKLGICLFCLRRDEDALKKLESSLQDAEAAIDRFGKSREAIQTRCYSLLWLGLAYQGLSRVEGALDLMRRSLAEAESLICDFGESGELLTDRARVLRRLGACFQASGDEPEALASYERSLADIESVISRFGESRDSIQERCRARRALGGHLTKTGKTEEALQLLAGSTSDAEVVVARCNSNLNSLRDLAESKSRLAECEASLGLIPESKSHLSDAEAAWKLRLEKYGPLSRSDDDALKAIDDAQAALGISTSGSQDA